MDNSVELKIGSDLPIDKVTALYHAVGWVIYSTEEYRPKLERSIRNSTYVVTAWEGEELVGLARTISDDVSIFFLQDILVHPEYQRRGIGRRLLENCLARFEHVRIKALLTDDEAHVKKFYESLGYVNTKNLKKRPLNAFVRVEGVELE